MKRGSKKNRLADLWVGTPVLQLLASFRTKGKPPANVRRIGVMCSPALGDTLLFSAALQDVRAAYPHAEIVHFCMKQNLAAAEIIPGADRRVLISLTRPLDAVRKLRAERLDMLLDFTAWQRITAICTLLSRAAFTVGFRSKGQHRGRAYDLAIEHRNDRHEIENFRALLRESGLVSHVGLAPALLLGPGQPVLQGEDDLVAMHLWASGQKSWLREWPDDRWLELAQRLARPGTLFLITGGPADRERAEPFVARMRAAGLRAEVFVSPDGFVTLTHVLRRVRVLISVNTGVMHLGAVAGAPTVSLNGPTAEHRWGARGPRVANVQPSDGSGGYLNFGFEFEGQAEDVMERISVQQVATACAELEVQSAVTR